MPGSLPGRSISKSGMVKFGLIINPIAGMGGSVALKGTDGAGVLEKALALGAQKTSSERAGRSLGKIANLKDGFRIYTAGGEMGESLCRDLGLNYEVVYPARPETTGEDTREACRKLLQTGIDCLIFAGGDGTARDVWDVIGSDLPALGIPAGVKIQSSVFALSPEAAGQILRQYILGETAFGQREVIDLDETAYREGRIAAAFYGYMQVPMEKTLMQNKKAPSPQGEAANRESIAREAIRIMEEDTVYLIGAGTTAKSVLQEMNLQGCLLGVDGVKNGELIASDLTARELMALKGERLKLIISPIGGQGFLFGRGNQQFSPEFLTGIAKDDIIILATEDKIRELYGSPFRVDTGSLDVDEALRGYYKVITGYNRRLIYPVK